MNVAPLLRSPTFQSPPLQQHKNAKGIFSCGSDYFLVHQIELSQCVAAKILDLD